MPIVDYMDLTITDVERLDREKTCFFLAIGPVEEHGPHLPLATDIYEAEGVARRLAAKLDGERPGWTMAFYPVLPLGSDSFTYPGTVTVRPSIIAGVIEDICMSLASAGFRRFVVASHHGGPSHNLALDAAARRVRRRTRGRAGVLSLAGRTIVDLYFGGGLDAHFERMKDDAKTREALKLDCHAGGFETAEMLALRPDLVRDGWQDLEPVLVPLDKLTRRSALCEGRGLGYFGAPALASKERGEAYLDLLVERSLPLARRFLDGEHIPGLELKWRFGMSALALIGRVKDALFPKAEVPREKAPGRKAPERETAGVA